MIAAADIARGLGLRRTGRSYSGRCPSCGYKGAFTAEDHKGTTLVRCHVGCEQSDTIDALRQRGLWPGAASNTLAAGWPRWPRPGAGDHGAPASEWALRLWALTLPAGATAVERYLGTRGYRGRIPPDLRYLPGAKHRETGTIWPAMVAAVRHVAASKPLAVHRSFLRPGGAGKAPVAPDKKTLGSIAGGAVRLAEAGERLAVTEGIETGLSVLAATGVPTWAALSAGGIRRLILPPPPLAAEITVCADHDPVGLAAAYDAAERWHREGRRVRLAVPPEPDTDFNDVAVAAGGGEP